MIDSNSNHHQTTEINRSMVMYNGVQTGEDVRKSYSSATMVKRRHAEKNNNNNNNMDVNLINIDIQRTIPHLKADNIQEKESKYMYANHSNF